MATNNAINLNAAGLARYDGSGTFSGVTVTQHSLLVGAASNGITSLALTNGQLDIGNTGSDPTAATLTAGTGISITNGSGSVTIASTGGLSFLDVTGTTQAMAINTAYLADNSGLVTLTLPSTAAQGSVMEVSGYGSGGWKIAQNASQQIFFGSSSTTVGTGGFLSSTHQYDFVRLRAAVGGSSTVWVVCGSQGNITLA